MIVLDLSKPGNCIESLLFWLSEVNTYLKEGLKEMSKTKPQEFSDIRSKASGYWNRVP